MNPNQIARLISEDTDLDMRDRRLRDIVCEDANWNSGGADRRDVEFWDDKWNDVAESIEDAVYDVKSWLKYYKAYHSEYMYDEVPDWFVKEKTKRLPEQRRRRYTGKHPEMQIAFKEAVINRFSAMRKVLSRNLQKFPKLAKVYAQAEGMGSTELHHMVKRYGR